MLEVVEATLGALDLAWSFIVDPGPATWLALAAGVAVFVAVTVRRLRDSE